MCFEGKLLCLGNRLRVTGRWYHRLLDADEAQRLVHMLAWGQGCGAWGRCLSALACGLESTTVIGIAVT